MKALITAATMMTMLTTMPSALANPVSDLNAELQKTLNIVRNRNEAVRQRLNSLTETDVDNLFETPLTEFPEYSVAEVISEIPGMMDDLEMVLELTLDSLNAPPETSDDSDE